MNTIKEILKNKSATIVDVRSSWEFEMEHISGARNIPLEEVANNLEEIKSFNNPVVLYCRSGNRSGMAVSILKQNGISDIHNGGGISDIKSLLN